MSIIQLDNWMSACSGGFADPCWRQCHEYLQYYLSSESESTATFGPRDSKVTTGTESCLCDSYQVYNARLVHNDDQAPRAVGTSPGNIPYSNVIMRSSSNGVSVAWTGGGTDPFALNDSCIGSYVHVSGPTVLEYYDDGFSSWWAVLVGCILGILLLCGMCTFCSYVGRSRNRGKPHDRRSWPSSISRSNRRPQEDPILITEMTSNPNRTNTKNANREWEYLRSSSIVRQGGANINPSGSERRGPTTGSGNVPIPIAIPVDENGRQIAIV